MAQIRRPPIKAKKQFPRRSSRDPGYDQVMGVHSPKPLDKQIKERYGEQIMVGSQFEQPKQPQAPIQIPEPTPIDLPDPDKPSAIIPPVSGVGVPPGKKWITPFCEICGRRGFHKDHHGRRYQPRCRRCGSRTHRTNFHRQRRPMTCWEMQSRGFDVMCLPQPQPTPMPTFRFDPTKPPKNRKEWIQQWELKNPDEPGMTLEKPSEKPIMTHTNLGGLLRTLETGPRHDPWRFPAKRFKKRPMGLQGVFS